MFGKKTEKKNKFYR